MRYAPGMTSYETIFYCFQFVNLGAVSYHYHLLKPGRAVQTNEPPLTWKGLIIFCSLTLSWKLLPGLLIKFLFDAALKNWIAGKHCL